MLTATTSSGPPSCYSHDHIVFLSINRFERKKNIALAVQALAVLRKTLPEDTFKRVHLVVAGGYDPRVKENVEYFEHLTELANAQGLLGEEESVSFVKSFTDAEKVRMLQMCAAVVSSLHEHMLSPNHPVHKLPPTIANYIIYFGTPANNLPLRIRHYDLDPGGGEGKNDGIGGMHNTMCARRSTVPKPIEP